MQVSGLTDLGYSQLTSLAAATALTVPAGCNYIIVQAETQAVRWRSDGVDPTASVGVVLAVGATEVFNHNQLAALRFIEATASAKLNIVYLGDRVSV